MDGNADPYRPEPPDRLDACAAVATAAAVFVVAVGVAIWGHVLFHQRAATPSRMAMASALKTLVPSLMPPGSPFHLPEQQHRSVDPRFSPGIPLAPVDPAGMLLDLSPWQGSKETFP